MPGDTVVVSKAPIVYVVGDVHKPSGIVMDKPQMTVLQAIALAEGTNPTAALNRAKVIRKTGGTPQEIPIQLKAILSSKAPDPLLEPDDILFVPTSTAKSAGRRGLEAVVQAATGVAIYRHP
jgi:polysaccharide export outer membrane protein